MSDGIGVFFILKKTKFSESDLILQGLSDQGEKVTFFAKGALRSKKRFGGGLLEPTHLIEAQYVNAKQEGGMKTLKEAKLLESFDSLRLDYDRLSLALFALDCISRVSMEGDQDSTVIFQLLGHLFKSLNPSNEKSESPPDLTILRAQFVIKFLFQQGVLTPEAWMQPFLRTSLHQSNELLSLKADAISEIQSLERLVTHYIRTADSGTTA